jgi:hypothetical protein
MDEPGDFRLKAFRFRVQNHLSDTRARDRGYLPTIDHDYFDAGWLGNEGTHHRGTDLPRATDDQDSERHG